MPLLLPLLALAIAGIAHFVFGDRRPTGSSFDWVRVAAYAIVVAIAGVAAQRVNIAVFPALGLATLLAIATNWLGGKTVPIALGVVGVIALPYLGAANLLPDNQLAFLVAIGLGALVLGEESNPRLALLALLAISANRLGSMHSEVAAFESIGSILALAVSLGSLLAQPIPEKLGYLRPVCAALIALIAALFASQQLNESAIVVVVAMGVVVGIVLSLLVEEAEGSTVRIGLAAIIGIGLATVSFAADRGLGMALALLAAIGILLATNHLRAILALGPLVGLVLYRVLREEGTGATRALDIGQHYTLLALTLGAIVPLMFVDWKGKVGNLGTAGAALWGILALTIPPLTITMFGARGAVGFVVGIGLAASIEAVRQGQKLAVYGAVSVLAPTTLLALQWASGADDLSRDQKIPMLIGAGTLILVIAGLLVWMSAPKSKEVAS
jgi:hypothetical protein